MPTKPESDEALRIVAERVLADAADRAKSVLEAAEARAAALLSGGGQIRADRWHIGKEIPLALVGAIVVQTVGLVWWLAQLSSNVTSLNMTIAELKAERYTREDARRDRELMEQKLQSQAQLDSGQERRINAVEGRMDRVERK